MYHDPCYHRCFRLSDRDVKHFNTILTLTILRLYDNNVCLKHTIRSDNSDLPLVVSTVVNHRSPPPRGEDILDGVEGTGGKMYYCKGFYLVNKELETFHTYFNKTLWH